MTGPAGRRAPGQRGLTLVELMVAMTLTGLVVGAVFSVVLRTSAGLRDQARIAELQQTLVAAETVIARDLREAGLHVPNGFRVAWDGDVHQAIEVVNRSDGPDELRVFAADPSIQARVLAVSLGLGQLTVDDPGAIEEGQVLVIADPREPPPNVFPVPPQAYDACVVRVAAVAGPTIVFDDEPPWGQVGHAHCAAVAAASAGAASDTMAFAFKARGYRIDPERPALGVLQRSLTAGITDDWEDLGVGFTDLQIATRWLEPDGVRAAEDLDEDGDPTRDWYAGDLQDELTAPRAAEPTDVPIAATVSLVVRTLRDVDGVPSAATPALWDPELPEHNPIGDRAPVELEGVADAARPEALRGARVYRWTTVRVHLRNLGAGR